MWPCRVSAMVSSDDLGKMKILDLAIVGAFAGGVAGALIGASTMFAVDVLMPSAAHAAPTHLTSTSQIIPNA